MGESILFNAVRDAGPRDALALSSRHGRWTRGEVLDAAEAFAQRAAGSPFVLLSRDIVTTAIVTLAGDLSSTAVVHVDPDTPKPPAGLIVRSDAFAAAEAVPLGRDLRVFLTANGDNRLPAAQVFHTSGSTGVPAGVVRGPEAVLADALRVADRLDYQPGQVIVATAPAFHAYGFNYALTGPLLRGAAVHHYGAHTVPSLIAHTARRERADALVSLPFQYRLLAESSSVDLPTVRRAVSAGAPLAMDAVRRLLGAHRFELFNCYGSSEAGAVTLSPMTGTEEAGDAGTLLPGIRAEVEAGELLLRSTSLALGRVVDGEFAPLVGPDGWYRTGDLAELDGSRVRLRGRKANVINVAGKKVSAEQVEQVLLTHPDVREAKVVGVPDPVRGEAPLAAVAVGRSVAVPELLAWCRDRLPPSHLPREITVHDELPRSATGKLTRSIAAD